MFGEIAASFKKIYVTTKHLCVFLVVYAEDGGAGYDMMVKNCFAYDSTNFKTANKIR
jgi:hypothetical protein